MGAQVELFLCPLCGCWWFRSEQLNCIATCPPSDRKLASSTGGHPKIVAAKPIALAKSCLHNPVVRRG